MHCAGKPPSAPSLQCHAALTSLRRVLKPRSTLRLLAPLGLSLAAGGCPDNNGADPPADQLFFPIAAALHRPAPDAQADFLYIVNANFDLRYNGSTVAALDLALLRQRLVDHQGCTADPASAGAWICDDRPLLRASFTRKINPYAVEAALATYQRAGAPPVQRLYVLVRGGNTMTWFDVDPQTGALDCGPPDAQGYCSAAHSTGSDPSQSPTGARLPPDPSSISVDERRGTIVVTHQSFDENTPRASLFYDPNNPTARASSQDTRPFLVNVVGGLPAGLSALALLPRAGDDPTQRSTWLAISRSSATFTLLQVYPGEITRQDNRFFLYRAATAPVQGLNSGADSRAIVLDPREPTRRAYVTSRRPEALLTLDLRNPNAPTVENAIPLPAGSSRLAAVSEGGRTVVYTVSYDARRIYAIDPSLQGDNPTSAILAQIASNRGPHTIVHDAIDRKLYVLDFLDAAVEVIDVAPTLPTGDINPMYNRRVLTVGMPGRRGAP